MYIYYTGKGAKKSGKHTEKEFLHLWTLKMPKGGTHCA